MSDTTNHFICIARIGRPHGIKGLVHVVLYTENSDLLLAPNKLNDKNGKYLLEIEELAPHKKVYLAKIGGITDRNQAESLCHTKLYISRNILPDIKEDDSFYYMDLVGLSVFINDYHDAFGTIVSVNNFGASDLLEIQPDNGNEKFFLPFTKNCVPDINIQEKRININLPDRFFDVPEQTE